MGWAFNICLIVKRAAPLPDYQNDYRRHGSLDRYAIVFLWLAD